MGNRISKNPVVLPSTVNATVTGQHVVMKGKLGELSHSVHPTVAVAMTDDGITFLPTVHPKAEAMAGLSRTLVNNMMLGVSEGFEKRLVLKGVGYKAQVKGDVLDLVVGLSHPVNIKMPEGIKIQATTPTELLITGIDKQLVGQVAANIRSVRPPEPYKGKGIRYANERIVLKEVKKK